MNRQYKRMMKKQEAAKAKAGPGARQVASKAPGSPQKKERTKPRQFVKEVIAELQKVNWPTRQEVTAYTIVVLVSVIVIATIIFGMDYGFTKAVLVLFDVQI